MLHAISPPLAAVDFGDLIKAIVPVVFFIIYGLNQLLQKRAENTAKERAKQRRPMPPGSPPPPSPSKAPQPSSETLKDEIGEFLRRAAERREAQGRQAQARKDKEQPAREIPTRTQQAPPVKQAPRPAAKKAAPPKAIPTLVTKPASGESVEDHVRKQLSSDEFTLRANHMMDEMTQADTQRREHEQEMFGRPVGTLGAMASQSTAAISGSSGQVPNVEQQSAALNSIAALFADPANVRQAIVLQEILTRPEDRW